MKKKIKKRSIYKAIKEALRRYALDHPTGFSRGGFWQKSRKDQFDKSKNTIKRIEDE